MFSTCSTHDTFMHHVMSCNWTHNHLQGGQGGWVGQQSRRLSLRRPEFDFSVKQVSVPITWWNEILRKRKIFTKPNHFYFVSKPNSHICLHSCNPAFNWFGWKIFLHQPLFWCHCKRKQSPFWCLAPNGCNFNRHLLPKGRSFHKCFYGS